MSEAIKEITDNNFKNEIVKSETPALLDFTAEWCPPCKMIAPILEELARDYKGKLKVGKINVDDNGQTATEMGVMNIPTIIFFKGGEEYKRMVGANPKRAYESIVKELVGG